MILKGTGKEVLSNIITDTYETREVLKDFEKCVIISLPKENRPKNAKNKFNIVYLEGFNINNSQKQSFALDL